MATIYGCPWTLIDQDMYNRRGGIICLLLSLHSQPWWTRCNTDGNSLCSIHIMCCQIWKYNGKFLAESTELWMRKMVSPPISFHNILGEMLMWGWTLPPSWDIYTCYSTPSSKRGVEDFSSGNEKDDYFIQDVLVVQSSVWIETIVAKIMLVSWN